MRNHLLFLLVASASMPAIAADEVSDRAARREAGRAERAEARSERQAERAQTSQDSEPPSQARAVERDDRPAPAVREERREAVQQRMIERRSGNVDDAPRPTLEQPRDGDDSVRNARQDDREQIRAARVPGPKTVVAPAGTLRETLRQRRQERIEARDAIGNRRAPIVSRVPREGTQPPPPTNVRPSSLASNHWRGDWRSDRRYDWNNYRRRHRSLFRLGFYYDPFGWDYRRYSIGSRLWPSYYRSSFWLNDPWQYRLPYAPPGYRWIRYYDDALLVDTWDGQVVDVIYNFFW